MLTTKEKEQKVNEVISRIYDLHPGYNKLFHYTPNILRGATEKEKKEAVDCLYDALVSDDNPETSSEQKPLLFIGKNDIDWFVKIFTHIKKAKREDGRYTKSIWCYGVLNQMTRDSKKTLKAILGLRTGESAIEISRAELLAKEIVAMLHRRIELLETEDQAAQVLEANDVVTEVEARHHLSLEEMSLRKVEGDPEPSSPPPLLSLEEEDETTSRQPKRAKVVVLTQKANKRRRREEPLKSTSGAAAAAMVSRVTENNPEL